MAIIGRRTTPTEEKMGKLEGQATIVSWAMRKLRRYVTYAPKVEVCVAEPAHVVVVKDAAVHLRVKALLLDL